MLCGGAINDRCVPRLLRKSLRTSGSGQEDRCGGLRNRCGDGCWPPGSWSERCPHPVRNVPSLAAAIAADDGSHQSVTTRQSNTTATTAATATAANATATAAATATATATAAAAKVASYNHHRRRPMENSHRARIVAAQLQTSLADLRPEPVSNRTSTFLSV